MIEELVRIVRNVGGLMREWRKSEIFEGFWDGPQYKARVDLMAHEALVDRLSKLEPGLPIISEENASSIVVNRPESYWLIDPIDGTASFIAGYPGFITQIALMEHHRPVLAAIYAPMLDELYTAVSGEGSYLNGERLNMSSTGTFETLIDNYPVPTGVAAVLHKDLKLSKYIECGSISLKICKVASGTADIFFKNVPVRDWDIAAPQLVLEESKGVITDAHGYPFKYKASYEHCGVIAANFKRIHERVVNWHRDLMKGDQKA